MTQTQYIEFCRNNGIQSFALREMPEPLNTVHHVPNGYRHEDSRGTRGRCRGPVDLPDMSHLNEPNTVKMQKAIKAAWAKRRKA